MNKRQRIKRAKENPMPESVQELTTDNYRILKRCAMLSLGTGIFGNMFYDVVGISDTIRNVLEGIGYISVPLYSFLEVKAFHHTESKRKHLLKIFLTSLASEIPFNMMRTGNPFSFKIQNMGLSAMISFICLWIADRDFKKPFRNMLREKSLNLLSFSTKGMIAGIGAMACWYLKAEYGLHAVPMLMIMEGAEHCSHKKIIQAFSLSAWCGMMILSENFTALTAVLALIPIYFFQNRKSLFHVKESKFTKKLERDFYPLCLWNMTITKIIILMI